MNATTTKKLDLVQEGADPSEYEEWRKDVFAAVIASRSGSGLAGASLSYGKGHMDPNVLADSECPDDMTAVSALTMFLGVKCHSPLTKGNMYQYWDPWSAAGKPTVYQRDQATAGHPTPNPVTISQVDPCWAVKPRETTTQQQRTRRNVHSETSKPDN